MVALEKHIVEEKDSVKEILIKLDALAADAIVFLVDKENKLIGSVTDGDIRRGLIKGLTLEDNIKKYIQTNPKYITKTAYSLKQLVEWRNNNFKIIPVVDKDRKIVSIINFRIQKSYLPIDAVIMAGGVGSRLMPLTENTPKPMLEIGGKPIMEYNVDLLKSYGVSHLTLSVKYLANIIENYYKDGSEKGMHISYVTENEPLGTIGAVKQIKQFHNDYILVMNSDLLTNINLEAMFNELISNNADMIIATTDYSVQIPYGVVESNGNEVTGLKEKPTYTYYSNAGIYIFKKEMVDFIPENAHFNATDLIEKGIAENKKVLHFPITDYWLDIGKHIDFEKAQKDVKNIKF